jgi:Heterokaryon incompatibility protein (HET)
MDQYKYTPLNAARGEIRLVNLLLGGFSDDIQIEIFHVEPKFPVGENPQKKIATNLEPKGKLLQVVDNPCTPLYKAVSYVWGSEVDPALVFIRDGGRPGFSTLPVTQNLAEAMRYLRKEDETLVLWIDAVCIN